MNARTLCAVSLTLLTLGCDDSSPIGGGWYVGTRSSMSMDDRGAKATLHRKIGETRIDVGTDVYNYRFYPPDCVVWQTGSAVFGACGNRRPFPVAHSGSLDWQLLGDRINYLGSFSVTTGRTPPQRTTFILIDSVRAVAARQPRLDESYQPTRRRDTEIDPSLAPTLGGAVVSGP